MRRADWQDRLGALIELRRRAPFEWGRVDCCLWVADAVEAMTGTDPAADIRGRYRSASGAARAMHRHGGLEGAGARCGAPIPPLCAAEGDVGVIKTGGDDVLAICMSDYWLAVTQSGLEPFPLVDVKTAWRVA